MSMKCNLSFDLNYIDCSTSRLGTNATILLFCNNIFIIVENLLIFVLEV